MTNKIKIIEKAIPAANPSITIRASYLSALPRNGVIKRITKKPIKFAAELRIPQLIASPTPGVRPTKSSYAMKIMGFETKPSSDTAIINCIRSA